MWNLALPLLQSNLRHHVRKPLTLAAQALEDIDRLIHFIKHCSGLVPCPRVGDRAGGFHNHLAFTGWGDWPHAQPPTWRTRDFLSGCPSLSHGYQIFKGAGSSPFAIVTQLHRITRVTKRGGVTYDLLAEPF